MRRNKQYRYVTATFSLQRLLGKEDKFFDLLEASARESRTSVEALDRFMKNPDELKTLDEFIVARRKEKKINDEISQAICSTFVTALEREDIEALSIALYKIPKTMEKIGERILLAPHLFRGIDLSRHVKMLELATDTVVNMIKELRRGVDLEQVKAHNDKLQVLEGKTLGHKMVKLQPINGFAAETSSAFVIWLATHFGIPVSTTHNISAAIMGVGSAKRFSAIKWGVVERIVWAWVFTIPVSGGLAWCFYEVVLLSRGR